MAVRTGRPNGRPPRPLERKRAAGNPGGRQLPMPPGVGQGLSSTGAVPRPYKLGPAGRALWREVWTAGRSWLSPDSDSPLVQTLCHAADEAEALRAGIESGEYPRFYVMSNGAQVGHPAVTQLRDLRAQQTTWLSMLGFSPSDRSRLGLADVRVRDELDELKKARDQRRSRPE